MRESRAGGRWSVRAVTALVVAAVAALVATGPDRTGESSRFSPERTPWGDPDLQGAFTSNHERGAPLERPDALAGWQAEWFPRSELARLNAQRTNAMRRLGSELEPYYEAPEVWNSRPWLISDPPDGKMPRLIPSARGRMAAQGQDTLRRMREEGPWVGAGLFARCITRGLPLAMMPFDYGNVYRIVQGPGVVAITYEMVHETRVVPLDGRAHLGPGIRNYLGDARGWFDGDALVVETTNFTGRTPFHGSSDQMKMVERFTAVGPDSLEWSVTLDDRATWSRPWTISLNLDRAADGPLEFACHEGNYSMRHALR